MDCNLQLFIIHFMYSQKEKHTKQKVIVESIGFDLNVGAANFLILFVKLSFTVLLYIFILNVYRA